MWLVVFPVRCQATATLTRKRSGSFLLPSSFLARRHAPILPSSSSKMHATGPIRSTAELQPRLLQPDRGQKPTKIQRRPRQNGKNKVFVALAMVQSRISGACVSCETYPASIALCAMTSPLPIILMNKARLPEVCQCNVATSTISEDGEKPILTSFPAKPERTTPAFFS